MLLAAVVVGSGIAAQSLSPGQVGLELAENAIATALGLAVIILVLSPISGAHLNPVISLLDSLLGRRPWIDTLTYIPMQVIGCIAGTVLANLMFGHAAVTVSTTERSSASHLLGEIVATAGLVLVVFLLARQGLERFAPIAVGAYIGAAYFFTSSTSFANPAITIGRIFTNSFTGIAPSGVAGFIGAQLVGGAIGYALVRLLTTKPSTATTEGPST
ncbi:MAG: aquaporin family protein [Microbacteriaceae bacterium]|nr:aquaporin family protein [Microbacteriaceae bacterium]